MQRSDMLPATSNMIKAIYLKAGERVCPRSPATNYTCLSTLKALAFQSA